MVTRFLEFLKFSNVFKCERPRNSVKDVLIGSCSYVVQFLPAWARILTYGILQGQIARILCIHLESS